MTDKWHDFSTAPKDGSAVIVITDEGTPYALRYGKFMDYPNKEGWFYLDGEEFAGRKLILWKKHPTAGGWGDR